MPLPLSVLPVVYCFWASARMVQLDDWFRSWVPDSVYSAAGGRSSVEAWYTTALDIEEVLSGATDSDIHLFVADVIKSLTLLIVVFRIWACRPGFVMLIFNIMLMLVCS